MNRSSLSFDCCDCPTCSREETCSPANQRIRDGLGWSAQTKKCLTLSCLDTTHPKERHTFSSQGTQNPEHKHKTPKAGFDRTGSSAHTSPLTTIHSTLPVVWLRSLSNRACFHLKASRSKEILTENWHCKIIEWYANHRTSHHLWCELCPAALDHFDRFRRV